MSDQPTLDPSGAASSVALPYHCFISYCPEDDETFDFVVARLRHAITGMFEAHTGDPLAVFVDRDEIEWGQRTRDETSRAISNATLFVPIITMRYFKSDRCQELIEFNAVAKEHGVTGLILPLILMGAETIQPNHPWPEVQLIDKLNYKSIESAWRDGYESPAWKRAMIDIVKGLSAALTQVQPLLEVERILKTHSSTS